MFKVSHVMAICLIAWFFFIIGMFIQYNRLIHVGLIFAGIFSVIGLIQIYIELHELFKIKSLKKEFN